MQAMWKHRRAVIERGGSGRLGRRGLPYLLLFQILLPLLAPLVDVFAVYGLIFGGAMEMGVVWLGFLGVQMLALLVRLPPRRRACPGRCGACRCSSSSTGS